ncbi:MAG TPA: ATP-binding protein [Flavitalea sp.]|nr:ATP-binding protein [Flavitalea sp.]
MIRSLFNWRTGLALVAILIISGTIIYSQLLAKKIASEERQRVEQWAEAGRLLVNDRSGISDRLVGSIISSNNTIPIIQTDEKGNIMDHANLDTAEIARDSNFVRKKLEEFKTANPPIEWSNPFDSTARNLYYYGNTLLLKQVKYYPLIQLLVVALFILVTIIALKVSFKSTENQVWAGMAKETAHQLGTPLTSLQGWVEILRESGTDEKMIAEIQKDIRRLELVSDRFGKIGSTPQLEPHDVLAQVNQMVDYIRRRAPGKIEIKVTSNTAGPVIGQLSPPLFDWVIENLLKNALDAMEGKGLIEVNVQQEKRISIDVTDNGKGIARENIGKVFNPGFTTKKRGWGLGLSLSKRIIEQYHQGELYVKQSEVGKGTTFRVVI